MLVERVVAAFSVQVVEVQERAVLAMPVVEAVHGGHTPMVVVVPLAQVLLVVLAHPVDLVAGTAVAVGPTTITMGERVAFLGAEVEAGVLLVVPRDLVEMGQMDR